MSSDPFFFIKKFLSFVGKNLDNKKVKKIIAKPYYFQNSKKKRCKKNGEGY